MVVYCPITNAIFLQSEQKCLEKQSVLSNNKCNFSAKLAKMFGEAPKRCEDVLFFSWATVSFLLYLSSLAAHKMPHDRQIYP